MDKQILFRNASLQRRIRTRRPTREPVLLGMEIINNDESTASYNTFKMTEAGLTLWLNDGQEHQVDASEQCDRAMSISRFILGPCQNNLYLSEVFPGENCYPSYILPCSATAFEQILAKFQLPAATVWMLGSDATHFQRYKMHMTNPTAPGLGFTMRLSSHGVFAMDLCASVSYHLASGVVNTFLHGCTESQQTRIQTMLESSSILAGHPLLLPVLLVELRLDLIEHHCVSLWNDLVEAETLSGQTLFPSINKDRHLLANRGSSIDQATLKVLGILQITAYADTHAKALLLSIEDIQRSIGTVAGTTKAHNKESIANVGSILSERLDFLTHRTQVTINDVQFYEKRAQAQQTAVYNTLAQLEAKVSAQIARAAKQDSSAMKAIAVMTMIFLPGTYIAAFFAMPILDFTTDANARLPSTTGSFWLYWAVTLPLTATVLAMYVAYLIYFTRKRPENITPSEPENKSV